MFPLPDSADTASALFTAYHDRILRYVLGMVHDPAEAEDLTQETFLRAYRARDTLRDPSAARGWLYRISTRVCLDHPRRRIPAASTIGEANPEQAESLASTAASAFEITESKETSACVQRCLDFLSDSYRTVILLHEGHSLTAPEIAELLDVPVGSVKIRLHRARRRLQQIMNHGCAVSTNDRGVPTCEPKSGVSLQDSHQSS